MIPKDVVDLVNKNGHHFHYDVVNFLRGRGWTVQVSPYYQDTFTDKLREIDIIAEKPFPVLNIFKQASGSVNVSLFIECKYINSPAIFWFDQKDIPKAIQKITQTTPPKQPDENVQINKHHYYYEKEVAKLFDSGKNGEEHDPIYKAINQSLHALLFSRFMGSIIPSLPNSLPVLHYFQYPIIVVNSFDNFYGVNSSNQSETRKIDKYFQLEVNYGYLEEMPNRSLNPKKEYFLIDIVSLDKLEQLLDELEKNDITAVREMVDTK